MKKILVTGGMGGIGSFITARLREAAPDAELVLTAFGEAGEAAAGAYVGDLRDPEFAKRIFNDHPDIDGVIHAAASAYNAAKFKAEPFNILRDDTACLLNVLGPCGAGVKVILLSSVTVYESVSELPFMEDSTAKSPAPVTPIGVAKFIGENALRWHAEQTGGDFTIWRLFNVVTPLEDHTRPGAHVHVDFYRKLFVERVPELEILGNGRQIRYFTWVEDVADAIVRFLDDLRTSRQTFNLGGGEPATLTDLAETLVSIGRASGRLPEDYRPGITAGGTFAGLDVEKRVPSLEKIQRTLGWTAPTGFRATFEKFINAKQAYAER